MNPSFNILENSLITPQTDAEQTLTLTHLDIKWVHFHPIQRLLFYAFPCSKSRFLETLVPSFKSSLAKTLTHYLPVSGNLYYPNPTHEPDPNPPEIRFKPGDSVSVTVAEYSSSGEDDSSEGQFNYLTGNLQRDCDKFYDLLPDFPNPRVESGNTVIPLLAVQITLFPGAGVCVGFINSHVVGDASSMVGFIKAWGKIAASGEDEDGGDVLAKNGLLPIYDRSLLKDPKGIKDSLWKKMKSVEYKPQPTKNLPTNKVRATFSLSKDHIERLKTLTRSAKPGTTHLSSFAVAAAYAWACLSRSAAKAGEEERADDSDEEYLLMPVDVRPRADPPLPPSYFGNCVLPSFAKAAHGRLKGELGFFEAAEVVGGLIGDIIGGKYDLFKDLDRQGEVFRSLFGKRVLAISGSPKFDLYEVDFGWGRPKKYEAASIDRERSAMSVSKSGEFEGGLEIGLSFGKRKMDAFSECFYGGLKDLKV